LEAGASWFAQAFHDPMTPDRTAFGPFVGAVGQLEWPLPHRFYARVELAGLFYFLRTGTSPAMSSAPTYRASAGLGVAF
ncbi:MAG TPA: hypothetical protein VF334_07595, partial [Polyangia bacterium]